VLTVSGDDDTVTVKGFAWSGGGRGIVRVEVSGDGGQSWRNAELQRLPEQASPSSGRAWAWTHWSIDMPRSMLGAGVAKAGGKTELICRAVDTGYNVQPELELPLWNLRGILNNAWHRVPVTVDVED
jgi:sulfite oxidase